MIELTLTQEALSQGTLTQEKLLGTLIYGRMEKGASIQRTLAGGTLTQETLMQV